MQVERVGAGISSAAKQTGSPIYANIKLNQTPSEFIVSLDSINGI